MKKYRQAALRAAAKAVLTCCVLVVLTAIPVLAEGDLSAVWWLIGATLDANWAAGEILKSREKRHGESDAQPYEKV